ncbi:MAG: hypothetical protein WC749_02550 [Dehalococcoidia bacterium]
MNRLTNRDEFGNADFIQAPGCEWQGELDYEALVAITEGLNRLAAYEDTRLTPSEIKGFISDAGQALQNPGASLRVKALERVAESAKQGLQNYCSAAKEAKGNCLSLVCTLKELCKALAALEGVKGDG